MSEQYRSERSKIMGIAKECPRLIVLLNPKSGSRQALSIWNAEVLPRLLDKGWDEKDLVLFETQHPGHATEILMDPTVVLKPNQTIMTLGGKLLASKIAKSM